MKMNGYVCMVVIMASVMNAAAQIASESFWTTSDGSGGEHYRNSIELINAVNRSVTAGTSGFDSEKIWYAGNDRMWPMAGVSLSHSGVVGACFPGSMGMVAWAFTPPTWRNSLRRLSVAPPEAASYYLSGLIRVDALDLKTNELCAAGFSAADGYNSALSSGIHYGVRNSEGQHYLAVFAGSAAFDLCELSQSSTGVTWQVVAQLDADINGDGVDAVYGWYATNNAAVLTAAVEGYVQAWARTNSLGHLRLTTMAEGRDGTISDKSNRIYFDEVRLGTNLTDVTTILPDPVIVYRQEFYKDVGHAPITSYGWTAHYGSEATPFFPVPEGYTYYAQPYVVASTGDKGYLLDNMPGTGDRAANLSGSAPKLVWTELSGAASADVTRLTSITFELGRQAGVRVAVQVDGIT